MTVGFPGRFQGFGVRNGMARLTMTRLPARRAGRVLWSSVSSGFGGVRAVCASSLARARHHFGEVLSARWLV